MMKQFLTYEEDQDHLRLISTGEWMLGTVLHIEKELLQIPYDKRIVWDVSGISDFDSAGVLLFIDYYERFQKETEVEIVGYTENQKDMYTLLHKHIPQIEPPRKKGMLENLGRRTYEILDEIKSFITFLGHLFYAMFHTFVKPKDIRFKETIYHIHQSGFNALIIIALTSFLVGMVISYQGSVQLAKFGADIFIVDTVAISITRELGPMITAIVIAGRSGSAYTAEIGAMKITEEIAAMRTMGFDPYTFLVLPRIFALMVALPLLIFFADLIGILGGMVAASMQLDISMGLFTQRLYEVLEVKHYLLGMMKGPVFAFLIAAVGCFRGFQVSYNTESVGLHTTASVVNSIFLVIAFDALFSVIFTELGL
ncbi:ABC transporter permease [Sulfurovum sp. XTW-4]|uniref:ABC transporter permease n=1 Tax=Sulfurovum xiamenensis TaxID=3019066 RepID=A0ABT7QTW1_9BACT|nr:ABC transporter permease [Sulfurovum xiamenensis]MDM5264526.1 ABC transporter permease [Sulfurovum xiamenensis]